MNSNLNAGMDVLREYTRQMNQIMDLAEKANKSQAVALRLIAEKLKSSLQKMVKDQGELKRCVNNSAKYRAILQPYIDLLASTKADIEKVTQ